MRWVALVALALLPVTGCTSDPAAPPPGAAAPSYDETPCPADVDAAILSPITCGYLTVPENRADPDRTIRVFVTRVEPRTRLHDDPVFVAGTNLGQTPTYGGIAPVAERLGREAILMDPRGVGHSEPTLACPEVEERRLSALTSATTDPGQRRAWLDAVTACRARLESADVDLDAYTVQAVAHDAADLREALGIEQWNVHSYGTASRIVLDMLRLDHDGFRSAFLDSPETEQVDARVEGAYALGAALDEVALRCREDAACRRRFGEVRVTLERALRRLDRHPQQVEVADAAGEQTTTIHVDGTMLLRLLRAILSDGGSSGSLYLPEAVPAVVSLAAAGRLDELAGLLTPVVTDDTAYCLGYVPKCAPHMGLSEGAYYSFLCRDPEIVRDATLEPAIRERRGFAEMFGRSPLLDLCAAWGEGPSDAPSAPVVSDVPTLVLIGSFAPYTRGSTIRRGLAGLGNATVVVNPRAGHNVLIGACISEARRQWHDAFSLSPRDLACLDPALPWTTTSQLLDAAASAGG